jgi:PTS system nitrogen regulatory IIA component
VPAQATEKHLQLLSELAQMFSEATFRESLASPTDANGVRAAFDSWEPGA